MRARSWLVVLVLSCTAAAPLFAESQRGGPQLEVWKGKRRMALYEDGAVVREFAIVLGSEPERRKIRQGDHRTPVGRYFISDKKGNSRFHRFLGINYPNLDDAQRGYARGLIDARQWADVYLANVSGRGTTPATRLGGNVGIHGFGNRPYIPVDWTEGCIAVSNEDADFLYERLPLGTPVLIHE